jgi:DNA uptake protein ComE-like DNA-binding protein
MRFKGIGKKRAEQIVDYVALHGPFVQVERISVV